MSRTLSMGMAINEAIRIAMETDPDVVLMGEDVAGGGDREGEGLDEMGGVLGTTRGLVGEFGMNRVRDTPIAEMGLIGTAVGAAATETSQASPEVSRSGSLPSSASMT